MKMPKFFFFMLPDGRFLASTDKEETEYGCFGDGDGNYYRTIAVAARSFEDSENWLDWFKTGLTKGIYKLHEDFADFDPNDLKVVAYKPSCVSLKNKNNVVKIV